MGAIDVGELLYEYTVEITGMRNVTEVIWSPQALADAEESRAYIRAAKGRASWSSSSMGPLA
jgi:hypothetical protein